jgi:hypothetical protein
MPALTTARWAIRVKLIVSTYADAFRCLPQGLTRVAWHAVGAG